MQQEEAAASRTCFSSTPLIATVKGSSSVMNKKLDDFCLNFQSAHIAMTVVPGMVKSVQIGRLHTVYVKLRRAARHGTRQTGGPPLA